LPTILILEVVMVPMVTIVIVVAVGVIFGAGGAVKKEEGEAVQIPMPSFP
jgi:hypothetical protein